MTMLSLALKNARDNWSRFALTGLAVALSVAFLTATLVLTDSITGTAAEDLAAANAGVDAVAQGDTLVEGEGGPGEAARDTNQALPAGTLDTIRTQPGVADAVELRIGFAKLVRDGVALGGNAAAVDIGRNWVTNASLNPYTIVDGTAPAASDHVAIDRKLAGEESLAVGDSVEVLTGTGLHTVEITGLVDFASAPAAPAQRTTLFAPEHAGDLLGAPPVAQILIEFTPDAEAAGTIGALTAALPDVNILSGSDYVSAEQGAITSSLEFLSLMLIAFAVLATVIGMTIIYNTFAIALAQRRREVALLRAVGAHSRQVLRSIMAEAAIVGVVATAAGLGVGLLSAGAMRSIMASVGMSFIDGPTVVDTTTVLIGAGVGIVVTLLSAWFPARKAAAAAPIEALREAATEPAAASRVRTIAGLVLLVAAAGGLVAAVVANLPIMLLAAVLLVPAVILAGPAIVGATVAAARPVLKRAAGVHGEIAATNLDRSPRRSASTALALSLGVTMIGFFALVAATVASSERSNLDESLRADYVVTSASSELATIDPGLAQRLETVDGVGTVVAVAQVDGSIDGSEGTIAGVNAEDLNEVFDLRLLEGSLADVAAGGVAVLESGDTTGGLGDVLTIRTAGTRLRAPVVAIVSTSLGGFEEPTHFVDQDVLAAAEEGLLDMTVYIAAGSAVEADLREAVASTPGAFLETRDSFLSSRTSEIDGFRNFIYGMLGLTVIIAIVGIANTTALSISERTREIGLLRAIGTHEAGVRRIVRLEAGLLSIMGALIGLASALLIGWSVIEAAGAGPTAVPWTTVIAITLGGAVAGVLVAAYPAWRGSRQPILEAIAV